MAPPAGPPAPYPFAWPESFGLAMIGIMACGTEAILGLDFSPRKFRIRLRQPRPTDDLGGLRFSVLPCGDASLDLTLRRHGRDVAVNMEQRRGDREPSSVI